MKTRKQTSRQANEPTSKVTNINKQTNKQTGKLKDTKKRYYQQTSQLETKLRSQHNKQSKKQVATVCPYLFLFLFLFFRVTPLGVRKRNSRSHAVQLASRELIIK